MKRSDDAQVGVVVAILIVALVVIVIAIIQVEYVPKWMNDKEAEHMEMVQNQFAALKSNIDAQCIARRSTPMSSPIKLGSEKIPYLISSRSFGSIDILSSNNSNFNARITSPDGKIEQTFSNPSVTNKTIENVTQISYFELVINLLGNQEFQVFVRDGENELGNMTVTVSSNSPYSINLTVNKMDEAKPIFDQPIATGIPGGNYRINLLNPDYKFYKIIGSDPYNVASTDPLTVDLSVAGDGTYCIEGKNFTSFTEYSIDVGTIKYSADNAYFPDQSYVYEGGSAIINQSVGSAMIFPPSFSVDKADLSFSMINVISTGGKDSASGYGTYSVKTDFGCIMNKHFQGNANSTINITINTDYPTAWFNYLNRSFNGSNGYANITVIRLSNSVKMIIQGINDNRVDLQLTVVEISARVE